MAKITSLMIGLGKGLIVKHNLASDSPVLFKRPYATEDITNPLIKGNTRDPEKIDANNKLNDCGQPWELSPQVHKYLGVR